MQILSDLFVGLVVILHIGFMVLESFLWETKFAKKRFGMTTEIAATTKNLALNQGVYNLFLAGGLIFAQMYRGQEVYAPIAGFFLGCVIVAGIVGAKTVSSRIFFIQAVPAILAAIFLVLAR